MNIQAGEDVRNFYHAVQKAKNMPILTIKVRPSFKTPWYGHEETKNTVIQYIKCLWHYSPFIIQCPYMLNQTLNIAQTM